MTDSRAPTGLILTPGASADREHATLVALDDGLPEIAVRRVTLATTSIARAVDKVISAAEALADELGVESDRIALGGRSFGGRACSMAVARGLPAASLVLLSYPLHPPGKPDALRVEHFGELDLPVLVVSGRKDPFGSPEEFEQHLAAIPGPVDVHWIDGGHAPKDDGEVVRIVRRFLVGPDR